MHRHRGDTEPVEFIPKAVTKVHGSNSDVGHQWRYLVEFQRNDIDCEHFGDIFKPVGAKADLGPEGNGSQYNSQYPSQSQNSNEGNYMQSQAYTGPLISVFDYDRQWLAAAASRPHRPVRQSLVREKWPEVESAWMDKLSGRASRAANGGNGRGRGRGRGRVATVGMGRAISRNASQNTSDSNELEIVEVIPAPATALPRAPPSVRAPIAATQQLQQRSPLPSPRKSQKQRERERDMPPGSIEKYISSSRRAEGAYLNSNNNNIGLIQGAHKSTNKDQQYGPVIRQRGLLQNNNLGVGVPISGIIASGRGGRCEKTIAAAREALQKNREEMRAAAAARQQEGPLQPSPSKKQRIPTQVALAPPTAPQNQQPLGTGPRSGGAGGVERLALLERLGTSPRSVPRTRGSLPSRIVPDSDGIKTLRRVLDIRRTNLQKREAAAAAEAEAAAGPSQPHPFSPLRQRSRQIGRIIDGGIIDLVSSPETSPERGIAAEERYRGLPGGHTGVPAAAYPVRRRPPSPIILDLTADHDEQSDDDIIT